MIQQPLRLSRPLPAQTPTAFLRARSPKKPCGRPVTTVRGRTCARSHRVTRI